MQSRWQRVKKSVVTRKIVCKLERRDSMLRKGTTVLLLNAVGKNLEGKNWLIWCREGRLQQEIGKRWDQRGIEKGKLKSIVEFIK